MSWLPLIIVVAAVVLMSVFSGKCPAPPTAVLYEPCKDQNNGS